MINTTRSRNLCQSQSSESGDRDGLDDLWARTGSSTDASSTISGSRSSGMASPGRGNSVVRLHCPETRYLRLAAAPIPVPAAPGRADGRWGRSPGGPAPTPAGRRRSGLDRRGPAPPQLHRLPLVGAPTVVPVVGLQVHDAARRREGRFDRPVRAGHDRVQPRKRAQRPRGSTSLRSARASPSWQPA